MTINKLLQEAINTLDEFHDLQDFEDWSYRKEAVEKALRRLEKKISPRKRKLVIEAYSALDEIENGFTMLENALLELVIYQEDLE